MQANEETDFSIASDEEKISSAMQANGKPTLSSPPAAEKSPFQKDAEAAETEWIPLEKSEGLTCAKPCGCSLPVPLCCLREIQSTKKQSGFCPKRTTSSACRAVKSAFIKRIKITKRVIL